MEKMTLLDFIEMTIVGTEIVIEYNDQKNKKTFYNCDTVPERLLELPVSFIENLKQFDGTTALCFTVYEY